MSADKLALWVAEAEEAARARKNSALPLNRRVRTGVNGTNRTHYTRGTVTRLGALTVEVG